MPSAGARVLFEVFVDRARKRVPKDDSNAVLLTEMAVVSLEQCPEMPEKHAARIRLSNACSWISIRTGGFGYPVSTVCETSAVYSVLHGVVDASGVFNRARAFILAAIRFLRGRAGVHAKTNYRQAILYM